MQHPVSPAKDAGSFNSGKSRNPRPLPVSLGPPVAIDTATTPVFPAKARTHIASRMAPPVFPAKAGIHVPSPASVCPPVAIDTATPHPSFRRKPESTSLPGVSRPASCRRHSHHSRLSSESPNPYRLPDGRIPTSSHRSRHSPPVFPAKAATHVVASPMAEYPRVPIGPATPHPSFRQKPESTSPPRCLQARQPLSPMGEYPRPWLPPLPTRLSGKGNSSLAPVPALDGRLNVPAKGARLIDTVNKSPVP